MQPILKILTTPQWLALQTDGETTGAPVDVADGYIHFSTPLQVDETLTKHFAEESDLWLLTFDAGELGENLRWEPARDGDLFPHLYGPLRLQDVVEARPL